MTKPNLDPKEILKAAKKREPQEQASFVFNATILDKFREKCKKEEVPMTRVLEEFMKAFVK